MNPETMRFIQERFSEHYLSTNLVLPPRFGRREWAFFMWGGKGMFRPVAFKKKDEVRAFLASRAPRHVYFSTAYYERPEVPMAEKKWMGADLIFDLDADHLKGAENMNYKEMLQSVKREFIRLVDDYIMGDFGFAEEDVDIVFSGGRGYHIHVRDRKVLDLGSQERREIVDYVTGTGLELDSLFEKEYVVLDGPSFAGRVNIKEGYRLPPPGTVGWRGRMNKAARHLGQRMEDIISSGQEKSLLKEMECYPGVGGKTAKKLVSSLSEPWGDHPSRLDAIQAGDPWVLDSWSDKKVRDAFLEMARSEVAVMAAETDEPVTSDMKRLIRMPSSLHGKSSLKVISMSRNDLDGFDPLKDAVVFGQDDVEIDVLKETVCYVNGEKRFTPGMHHTGEAMAMFMLCSGSAIIPGSESPKITKL